MLKGVVFHYFPQNQKGRWTTLVKKGRSQQHRHLCETKQDPEKKTILSNDKHHAVWVPQLQVTHDQRSSHFRLCVKKCDVCYVSIPTGVRGKIGNLHLHKRPMEVARISRILVGQSRNWTEIFIKAPKKIVSTMPCFLFTDFRHPSLNVSQPGKCEESLCCVFCRPYRHQNAIQIRLSLFSLVI